MSKYRRKQAVYDAHPTQNRLLCPTPTHFCPTDDTKARGLFMSGIRHKKDFYDQLTTQKHRLCPTSDTKTLR